MGTGRAHIVIARPVDEVWAVVRDFCSVTTWFPGVESCTLTDGVRRVRTIDGTEVDEGLVTADDELRRQQYRLLSIPRSRTTSRPSTSSSIRPGHSSCTRSTRSRT